jgi:FAD/FMN-containing dehydrogenase
MVTETGSTPNGDQPESKAIAALAARLQGELVKPGDPAYDSARTTGSAAVERGPALIVRCADAVDVMAALDFARAQRLFVAVRSGDNGLAAYGTGDGGVLIDLSNLRGIDIDPVHRTARIEPGLSSAEIAAAAHRHGLALPSSTRGAAGAGGPITGCLRGMEIITAGGRCLRASASEHADLFWSLRGGEGNVGVAVAFEIDLQPRAVTQKKRVRGPIPGPRRKERRSTHQTIAELMTDQTQITG